MTETPQSAPQPAVSGPVPAPREHPHRLYQALAWVGIVAGVLLIVSMIFFAGVMAGRNSDDGYRWHRGHYGGPGGPGSVTGPGMMGPGMMGPGMMGPGMYGPGRMDPDDMGPRAPMGPGGPGQSPTTPTPPFTQRP